MKKILYSFIALFIGFVILPIKVSAANALVDIYTSSKNPMVGDTVNVTVYVTSPSPLGTYEYSLSYDKDKLKLTSGSVYNVGYPSDSNIKKYTKTFSFKVIASGSSTVTVKSASVLGYDESKCSLSIDPVSIKGITQDELEASYSTNNYLKSLSIDGNTLTPTFNKETLNYKVTLNPNVEKITVKATKEDSTASVKGTGEIKVSEGDNKIEIVVTSQKGTKRTYTIIATVTDTNPIEVNLDGKKYTVVKKESTLVKPDTYKETDITINGMKVPGFISEITSYVLVGLKDPEGNVALYQYFEDGTYSLYQELKFNSLTITPVSSIDGGYIPKGYKEFAITINDKEIKAYKLSNNSTYSLFYGLNLETGESSLYLYEETEHTIQKYSDKEIKKYIEKEKFATNVIYGMGIGIVVLSFLLIIVASKKSKPKRKKQYISEVDNKEIIKESKLDSTHTEILDQTTKHKNNSLKKKKEKKKSLNKMLDDM